jgi:hypothetical protein
VSPAAAEFQALELGIGAADAEPDAGADHPDHWSATVSRKRTVARTTPLAA